jgi:hypothetical protein
MINYFKYTSGDAFTLSGVDYNGFVNIVDGRPFTGRVKNSFSVELSAKNNFLSKSILERREFDNSPTSFTTNKLTSPEYSPRNVLSNDFLRKNFNILYQNNLSIFSLSQVYNNSYLDTSSFKGESKFGGFFGLSSTTVDERDDDNNTLKDLVTPYHIDPFKSASKERFPDLFELDNAKKTYIETFDDGFVYTITTDTKTIAFSGCFTGQIEKIRNNKVQNDLNGVKNLVVDKANGFIYSPSLEDNGVNYTNIYDRDIYRACSRLKLVDRIKTSNFRVVNNNVSFGKTYKVVQVINDENNVVLEISPNRTSEILATLPISNLNNPEYVKVESRFTDDLLLIVTKPVSNTEIFNTYFIDLPEFIESGVIPEPIEISRVNFEEKPLSPIGLDNMFTVFGVASSLYVENTLNGQLSPEPRYYYPLFENKSAVKEFSLSEPREITFPEESSFAGRVFYFAEDYLNGSEERPDGFFIYRGNDKLIKMDISFSDYDSNLFLLTDNGNVTERMITNPLPVTSFTDLEDLLLPPDILFTSPYKFNTNSWKFNTNLLESNNVSLINNFTDTLKDKTYSYYHNIGRIYFSSDKSNKKRISLAPADLQSFFNPDIFNTVCETSLGVNVNILIQDILRDTINIYNNFTRIPKAGVVKSFKKLGLNTSDVTPEPAEKIKLGRVTSRVENTPFEPLTDEQLKLIDVAFDIGSTSSRTESFLTYKKVPDLTPFLPKSGSVFDIREDYINAQKEWDKLPNPIYAKLPDGTERLDAAGTKTRKIISNLGPFKMMLRPAEAFNLSYARDTRVRDSHYGVDFADKPDVITNISVNYRRSFGTDNLDSNAFFPRGQIPNGYRKFVIPTSGIHGSGIFVKHFNGKYVGGNLGREFPAMGVKIIGRPSPVVFPDFYTEEEKAEYANDPDSYESERLRFVKSSREARQFSGRSGGDGNGLFFSLFGYPPGPKDVEYTGIFDSVHIKGDNGEIRGDGGINDINGNYLPIYGDGEAPKGYAMGETGFLPGLNEDDPNDSDGLQLVKSRTRAKNAEIRSRYDVSAYKKYLEIRDLSKREQIEYYYDRIGRKGPENYYIVVEDHVGNISETQVDYGTYSEFQQMSEAEKMERYYVIPEVFDCENANVRWKEGVDEYNLPKGANLNQLIEVSEGTILDVTPSQVGDDYGGEIQTFTVRVNIPDGFVAPNLENIASIPCKIKGTNGENFYGVKVFNDYKIPAPLEIDTRNFYFHSNESVNYLSVNRVFSKLFELQKTIYDSILSS